ncbi:MAG: RNA-binding S4 domain-containing protein [Bacteroidales bacterium]|nr:RNA-binding S4 domain-containing protein [Candidatus Colicola coprequi]
MSVRVDKYLFAMRIYKTRSIATDACKKGRVTMNGTELKPSRTFEIGNKFSVRKGPITYTYEVLRLSENRLGAKLVPDYLRDITAKDQLELLELARLAGQNGRDRGAGRPTKKDRREIEQFISDDYYLDNLDDLDDLDNLEDIENLDN